MVDLFWLWRSENDGKCSFSFFLCIYTDKRTFRTVEQIWKKHLFRQKNAACAHTSRKFLMPQRVCPGGVQQASVILTSWSDLQWVRPHLEWRGDAYKALYQNSSGGWIWNGFPTGKLVPMAITIAAQFPNAPLSASYVHAFISFTYLFCVKRSNTKNFLICKP